jgi:hypothetical protein
MQTTYFSMSDDGESPQERIAKMRRVMARMNPPDNEAPGVIPISAVIARGDDVAVVLTHAKVYSTGINFDFLARRSQASDDDALYEQVNGHHHRGTPQLLIGVEYADGRRVTNLPGRSELHRHSEEDTSPVLWPGGGGGGSQSVEIAYWLWPRPATGALTVVCAWPALGIAETRTVISAEAIATAGAQNVELWQWEPPADRPEPPPQPIPDLPHGWFKDASSSASSSPETESAS